MNNQKERENTAERGSWEQISAVLERIHALPLIGPPIDHGDLLYGDDGLPK